MKKICLALALLAGCSNIVRMDPYHLADLHQKAVTGDADAQYKYALSLYAQGYATRSMTKEKFAEVMDWYRKSAEQGNIKAKTNLGHLLRTYFELSNYSESEQLLKSAAKYNDVIAEYNLGEFYDPSAGASNEPIDIDKAIYWYEKAAGHGATDAQNKLGEIYFSNKKDYVSSYAWLSIAKTSQFTFEGERTYRKLNEKILDIQKVDGEKMAIELMNKHPDYKYSKVMSDRHTYEEEFKK